MSKSNESLQEVKKRYKRRTILSSVLCGTTLAGAGVGVGYVLGHKNNNGEKITVTPTLQVSISGHLLLRNPDSAATITVEAQNGASLPTSEVQPEPLNGFIFTP
jgi:hypothetical protein